MSGSQLEKLNALLDRVRQNAATPRPARVSAAGEEPAPEIEVSAEATDIEDLDLSDDEIVDITDADIESMPPEEPPASSRRPIAPAATMEEAISEAAEQIQMQDGREVPLVTPPPESGPQEAPMPPADALRSPSVPELSAAEADGVDSLLDPTPADSGPSPSQIGQTVELDDSGSSQLELDEPLGAAPPRAPAKSGPALSAQPLSPEVTNRTTLTGDPAKIAEAQAFHPENFAALLDASIALGK